MASGNLVGRLKAGKFVWIPCEVKQGMFPTERYIRIEIPEVGTVISGFISKEDIRTVTEAAWKARGFEEEVRAVIAQLTKDTVALLFRGEILSATNPVRVPTEWLNVASHAAT